MSITHLIYWYSFHRFLESKHRPMHANQHIRNLFETEKRMLLKQLSRR